MIQAIIFDLYGVLALNGWQGFKAKHFSARPAAWAELYELGRQVDAGLAEYDDFIRFTAEQTDETEATVRYQLEHTQANDELLDYIASQLKLNYKLGILSNASTTRVLDEVLNKPQRELFDSVTFSHHVGKTKPDPDMYALAAERLGAEPGECLFVDDQPRHVHGAESAGMQALLYTDCTTFKADFHSRAGKG